MKRGPINPSRGTSRPLAKLTDADVREIRRSRRTPSQLARDYGVHYTVVYKAKRGITWKHVVDGLEQDSVAS